MLAAGCPADQVTNTYYYVEAAQNQSPSDLYFYQLPMGLPLPNGTRPSCSSCVKSLMSTYASALHMGGNALSGLRGVYEAAAVAAEEECGRSMRRRRWRWRDWRGGGGVELASGGGVGCRGDVGRFIMPRRWPFLFSAVFTVTPCSLATGSFHKARMSLSQIQD
ncbi:hypothetical protein FIBSPDRAFT_827247 [Athelia psychrophila]|uniref:DUF7729 domain-containing protein n=1 Tax=Athelia psychrophila TaxID=1759441 RepID=A0A166IT96_9AGAM|nr:hypothetical protein FIBSPDRAFT_827247 [Fibularhizoctonia sp. CBS 109695]